MLKRQFSFGEIEILNHIHTYVEIGDIEKVKEWMDELKQFIQVKRYTEEQVKVFVTKSSLDFYEKIKRDYELDKSMLLDTEQIIQEIYNTRSLSEMMESLVKRLIEISRKISFNSSDKSIKRIVKYIDKNYSADLKLEFLSEIFNYNSAYLGKVFKSYTGVSFNTYLDTVRINHAKKLLLEDKIKVYQVCERVGYKNIDYFHSKFKKYVGVSPLTYKKQAEGKAVKLK